MDIALSIFYGDVDIYVARGREPTAADYDYASDEGDYLRVVSHLLHCTAVVFAVFYSYGASAYVFLAWSGTSSSSLLLTPL